MGGYLADYVAGFESGFNSVASAQRHDGRLFPELSAEGDNTASDFFCYLNGKLPHQLRIFSLDHSGYYRHGAFCDNLLGCELPRGVARILAEKIPQLFFNFVAGGNELFNSVGNFLLLAG